MDGVVLCRQRSGIRVQPHVPCFGTHVQLNVMGLYHLTEWAVTRYLRHPEETPFVGGG